MTACGQFNGSENGDFLLANQQICWKVQLTAFSISVDHYAVGNATLRYPDGKVCAGCKNAFLSVFILKSQQVSKSIHSSHSHSIHLTHTPRTQVGERVLVLVGARPTLTAFSNVSLRIFYRLFYQINEKSSRSSQFWKWSRSDRRELYDRYRDWCTAQRPKLAKNCTSCSPRARWVRTKSDID